ncbi:type IV secretion system protein [Sphingomonas sp. BN140010]|uniref:Type IV secretion system protein n=1 Tax=Sphingomonas arvum TaxID=2992113 RepID=A0ABT3JDK5_9SPHN|nr:type IV secretion system protein [Sphingomonas sp. BN140010]MCW3796886.1 type IV secretion system protein [Sphingomonas sp. BN140010]
MSDCPTLTPDGTAGVADALRVVDCASANATASAFGRLFGPDGGLGTALTLLLTLYVGLLAVNLLSGRSRLGLNMLTPRMLAFGLVLTFATSWMAYQSVVWNLLTGAPDQIASVITGQGGSATAAFASRLDDLFTAVASAAEAASTPAPMTATGVTPAPAQAAGWTAGDVLWLAAMLLLLGTVGVLLVARIALAALLAVGPVFIVLALFRGTHGLFVGWLKGAVMFAVVPLFTVLIGGAALVLLAPVVAELKGGAITMRAAVTMFLGAAVYVALMVLVLRVSGTIVSGWRIGGRDPVETGGTRTAQVVTLAASGASLGEVGTVAGGNGAAASTNTSDRVRAIVDATRGPANDRGGPAAADRRTAIVTAAGRSSSDDGYTAAPSPPRDQRLRGVGARFRPSSAPVPGRPKP